MTWRDWLKLSGALLFILGVGWLVLALLLVLAGAATGPALAFAAFAVVVLAFL